MEGPWGWCDIWWWYPYSAGENDDDVDVDDDDDDEDEEDEEEEEEEHFGNKWRLTEESKHPSWPEGFSHPEI